jgi:hypothetical protein
MYDFRPVKPLGLSFVDKYIRHVNQFLFCEKVNIWRRRSQNSEKYSNTAAPMPRKKCSALASSENKKKSIEEERPEKRMRIDHHIPIASAGEKEVC